MMRCRRQFCWIGGVLLLVMAALLVTKPTTPEGRYVASSSIGAEGDFYWEFANGKLFFVCHSYADRTAGLSAQTYRKAERCTYSKTNDGWYAYQDQGSSNALPSRIDVSWFGLSVIAPDGTREFFRRRFIGGTRPKWMFDNLPWGIQ